MDNTELTHSGIKGMHWGIRRWQNKDGSLTPEGKIRYAEESSRDPRGMDDAELNKRINRLRLEKTYNELMKEMCPEKQSKVKEFFKRVLEKSGENICTQLTTYAMGAAVNAATNAAANGKKGGDFGESVKDSFVSAFKDGNIVNPKKGQKDK